MPKFSEIFQKLESAEEYNKYPFMLAVKKKDEPCFNPIYIFGKSSFVDRAFITIAGGLSAAPENPEAPLRRPDPRGETIDYLQDSYKYTEPFISPTDSPDKTYEYWVLKGDTPVSLSLFKAAAESINCALEYVESEEDSVEVLPIDLNSIQFDAPLDDPQEVVEFIKKAENFLTFHLDDKTNFGDLKEVLRSLFDATDNLNEAMEKVEVSYWANYDFDTGNNPEDNNTKEVRCLGPFVFDEDAWEKTFDLLKKISKFEFDKKYAYCDIEGRAKHLSDLNDRLANKINCLFYSKWKELFTWYSNRMQAIPLNQPIPEAEDTLAFEELSKLCDYDVEKSIMPQFCFSYTYLMNTPQILPCQQLQNYVKAKGEISKALAAKNAAWIPVNPINASVRSTLPNGETSQFYTIMKNLFWLYRNNKSPLVADIELNSTVIAKAIRLFAEYSLKLLYYMGYLPMASIYEIQRYDKKTKRPLIDPKTGHPLTRKDEWVYYIAKDERIVSGVFYISQLPVLSEIAKSRNLSLSQMSTYLNMIHFLTDGKNNELMHNDGFFTPKEVSDSLDRIKKITTWLQGLL